MVPLLVLARLATCASLATASPTRRTPRTFPIARREDSAPLATTALKAQPTSGHARIKLSVSLRVCRRLQIALLAAPDTTALSHQSFPLTVSPVTIAPATQPAKVSVSSHALLARTIPTSGRLIYPGVSRVARDIIALSPR